MSTFPIVHVFLKYNVHSYYSSNVFILLQIIDFYKFLLFKDIYIDLLLYYKIIC